MPAPAPPDSPAALEGRLREPMLEADSRFRELVEGLDAVFWIFDPAAGRVDYVSPAYEAIWGRSRESLYASPRSFLEAIHPEDLPLARHLLEQQPGDRTVIEYRLIRPDGTVRWIQDRRFPLPGAAGRPGRVAGMASDVSTAKAADERNHLLAEVSRMLAGTLAVPTIYARLAQLAVPALADLCIVDLLSDGQLHRATTCARPGREEMAQWVRRAPPSVQDSRHPLMRAMAQRQQLHERVDDERRTELGGTVDRQRLIEKLQPLSYVITPLLARGRVLGGLTFVRTEAERGDFSADEIALIEELTRRTAVFVDNASLFQDAEEARERAEAIAGTLAENVQRLRRAETDLTAAVRLRDDFLSVASHELKTPLTTLRLQVDGLQRHATAGRDLTYDRIRGSLDRIHAQVGRLERLIEELLDVSRIQAGHLELRPEMVDLADVAAEVVGVFRQHPDYAGRIELRSAPGVLGIWDRSRLDQILTNLLSNAVKYGLDQPVEVEVRAEDERAIIDVTDHGIGIAAGEQTRIFQRFERAAPAEHYGGIGLGLWIVKEVIEAMGGSISLRSEVGMGSTFTVRLPRDREPR